MDQRSPALQRQSSIRLWEFSYSVVELHLLKLEEVKLVGELFSPLVVFFMGRA